MTAAALIAGGVVSSSIAASTTVYAPLAHCSLETSFATEADAQVIWRRAGTLTHLYVKVINNDRGASTVKVRKNTANANLNVSIGSSATGVFEDTSNSDSLSSGDLLDYQVVTGAGGTTFTFGVVAVQWADNTDTGIRVGTSGSGLAFSTASVSRFNCIGGTLTSTATEAFEKYTIRTAASMRNLYANVQSNTRISATSVQTRVNGANGNLTLSVGIAASGQFEDTTNTDTLVAGDQINLAIVTGIGAGTVTFVGMFVTLVTTNGNWPIVCGSSNNIAAGLTRFTEPGGVINLIANDANTRGSILVASVATALFVNLSTNTLTGSTTVDFRVNGVSSALTISIGAAATGLFEDTTHTATMAATDVVNFRTVTGTGTSITFRELGVNVASIVPISSSDTGSGADTTGSIGVSSSDTSSSIDAESISATLSSSEIGSGADAHTAASVTLANADSGSGSDAQTPASASLSSSDTTSGAEDQSSSAALSSSDASTSNDAGSITASIAGSDTGSTVDDGTNSATVGATETASSTDDGSLAATLDNSDSAAVADAEAIVAQAFSAELASIVEGATTLTASLVSSDDGSIIEAESVLVVLSDIDSGHGVDLGELVTPKSSADFGVGVDHFALHKLPTPPPIFAERGCDVGPTSDRSCAVGDAAVRGEPVGTAVARGWDVS